MNKQKNPVNPVYPVQKEGPVPPPSSAPVVAQPISRSAVYFAGFVALGLAMAIIGPTLPILAENTGSQISQIGILFTVRSLGGLIGAPLTGRLYDRRPGHKILALVLLAMALMLALLPLGNHLWQLALVVFFLGIVEIGLDIGGNTLLMWLHGERVSPYMNALHFFFGVGAFFAPIILAQMLLLNEGPAGVRWTYWLIALLMLPVAAWVWRTASPESPEKANGNQNARPVPRLILFFLIALFFLYVGAEVSFGGWIYSYALQQGLATAVSAAYLTSLFWGALMVGRLISVPLARWVPPRGMLAGALVGCLFSSALLLSRPDSMPVLYAGTAAMGLFMAVIFPTLLSFAERRMTISGRVTSWFFIGATLGAMSLPWLAGQVLDRVSPLAFLGLVAAILVAEMVVFLLLVLISWTRPEKR